MFYTNLYQDGNTIYERYIEDGADRTRKLKYSPVLYKHGAGSLKDIYGASVVPVQHETIGDARRWMREMQSINKEVLGMDNFVYQHLYHSYPGDVPFNQQQLDIHFLDIEVPTRDGFPDPKINRWEIDAITVYSTKSGKFHVFTTRNWCKEKSVLWTDDDGKPTYIPDLVDYHQCDSERQLLAKFIVFFKENTPHIISGWNTEFFDIPYTLGRIEKVLGSKFIHKMSPFGIANQITVSPNEDETIISWEIAGVACIDYLAGYKKFTFKRRPNYRLDYIGQVEVGAKKIPFTHKSYLDFAEQDPQLYIDYNIRDVDIVRRLDDRVAILSLILSVAYYAHIGFEDVFSPLKTWDAVIHMNLHNNGIICPENKSAVKTPFCGAYVKQPITALYKWVKSFDLTSLYPHIIMGWNISPDTMMGQYDLPRMINDAGRDQADLHAAGLIAGTMKLPDNDYCFAGNGMMYTREKRGILPIEVEKVFKQRKEAKTAEFYADKVATWAQAIITDRHGKDVGTDAPNVYKPYTEDELKAFNNSSLTRIIELARKEEKLQNVTQQAKKVLINSLYGALGNKYFRFFQLLNAEAVTTSGQWAIQWIMRKMNEFLNAKCGTTDFDYVIYGDTDSIYLNFEPFVEMCAKRKGIKVEDLPTIKWVDFLDKYAREVCEPYIDKSYRELAEYARMYEHKLFMDREIIADRAFWTGKKRYAANVWDSEGKRKYDSEGNVVPKLKIMGIETQRSSTPPFAADMLMKSIKTILTKTEADLQELVTKVKAEYPTVDYREVCSVSSANNLDSLHNNFVPVSGCPGHVKSAINFNMLAEKYGADPIRSGDKIQMMILKQPNPLMNVPTLAIPSGGEIPREFNIDIKKYIDFTEMYEKHYIKPLTNICESIGWVPEKKASLDDLFGDW